MPDISTRGPRPLPIRGTVHVEHFDDDRIASIRVRAFRENKAEEIAIQYVIDKFDVSRGDLEVKMDNGIFTHRVLVKWSE